jgi:DNA-binding Lrp family transcriptional regulator
LGASAIDTLQREFVNSLFKGKEGANNCRILELMTEKPLTFFEIQQELDKKYSTVHDRITALAGQGIVEEKGKKAAWNKQLISLWGLSPLGLWVAAHRPDMVMARVKCGSTILEYWRKFTAIYELDKVQTEPRFYEYITNWFESDEGLLEFLDTFGAWPLAGEGAALGTFRRMIDLALLHRHGASVPIIPGFGKIRYGRLGDSSKPEWYSEMSTRNPYLALAEIAAKHEMFSKLDAVLREVDAPLREYHNRLAHDELVPKLRVPLREDIAEKLAVTPFFIDKSTSDTGVSSQTLSLISPDSLADFGAEIVIEADRVSITTDDPDRINPLWKDYCDVYVLPARSGVKARRIPAKRKPE